MEIEVDPGEHPLPAESPDAAHLPADRPLRPDPVELIHLPAHHVANEEVPRHLRGGAGRDVRAVAQHRDPIRDLEDFLEPVGDEEHRHPPVAELAGHPEELPDLVVGEGSRRLVHDEDLHLERDGLRDLDRLLRGEGEPAGRRPDVEPYPEAREDVLRLGVHARPVDEQVLVAVGDEDVLGDVEVGEDEGLLVDGGESVGLGLLGVGEVHGPALHPDLSRIAVLDAGQDLDEGRLAGAVLSHEGVDLAGVKGERHVVERLRHVEALGEAAHLQHRHGGRGGPARRPPRCGAGHHRRGGAGCVTPAGSGAHASPALRSGGGDAGEGMEGCESGSRRPRREIERAARRPSSMLSPCATGAAAGRGSSAPDRPRSS